MLLFKLAHEVVKLVIEIGHVGLDVLDYNHLGLNIHMTINLMFLVIII